MLKQSLAAAALATFVMTFTMPTLAVEMSAEDMARKIASGNIVGDEITKKECGACHMVYGPINLISDSWKLLMSDLPNHFGEDATLDEPTRKHIEDYLLSKSMDASGTMYGKMKAKKVRKMKKLPIRLSTMPGWAGDHKPSKIGPEIWARVNGNKSDCKGCHMPGMGG